MDFLHDILQEIHLHMMDVAGYDCCSGQRVAIDIAGGSPIKTAKNGTGCETYSRTMNSVQPFQKFNNFAHKLLMPKLWYEDSIPF